MFSYLESLTDDNLQKYAPRALKGMTNTGTEFIVRALPVATFKVGLRNGPWSQNLILQMLPRSHARVMHTRQHLHSLGMLNVMQGYLRDLNEPPNH